MPHVVVLVEGLSDQCAVTTLARRCGLDLDGAGVAIVPMGGAHATGRFLRVFGPRGHDVRVAGLYDVAEEADVRRGVDRSGLGCHPTRQALEAVGFFACVDDLEDELIRAVGTDAVIRILEGQEDLDSFRRFQRQPAQRGRDDDAQLRRFLGTRSGRKLEYARLLVDALDLSRVPRPLDLLLRHVQGA